MKKRILIIGGYHKAQRLARSFLDKGYDVTAINKDPAHCQVLAQMRGLTVMTGDGSKPFAGRRCGGAGGYRDRTDAAG